MCEGGSLPLRIADPCGGCYGIHVPPGPGEGRPTKGVHTYVAQNSARASGRDGLLWVRGCVDFAVFRWTE